MLREPPPDQQDSFAHHEAGSSTELVRYWHVFSEQGMFRPQNRVQYQRGAVDAGALRASGSARCSSAKVAFVLGASPRGSSASAASRPGTASFVGATGCTSSAAVAATGAAWSAARSSIPARPAAALDLGHVREDAGQEQRLSVGTQAPSGRVLPDGEHVASRQSALNNPGTRTVASFPGDC